MWFFDRLFDCLKNDIIYVEWKLSRLEDKKIRRCSRGHCVSYAGGRKLKALNRTMQCPLVLMLNVGWRQSTAFGSEGGNVMGIKVFV